MYNRTYFSVTIIVIEPSSPPLDIEANATDSHSISLHWEPPLPVDRNGRIVSYLINMTAIETGETFEINTTYTILSLSLLTPFTAYEFVIAASTAVGLGPFSEPISVLTPEDGKR
jgi:receptor-type tyrosine-protein phosphatase Q